MRIASDVVWAFRLEGLPGAPLGAFHGMPHPPTGQEEPSGEHCGDPLSVHLHYCGRPAGALQLR